MASILFLLDTTTRSCPIKSIGGESYSADINVKVRNVYTLKGNFMAPQSAVRKLVRRWFVPSVVQKEIQRGRLSGRVLAKCSHASGAYNQYAHCGNSSFPQALFGDFFNTENTSVAS